MTESDPASPQRGDLNRLIRRVAEGHDFDLAHYRRSYIERRLSARMRALGLITYHQYGDRLEHEPEEFARFIQVLTIGVTEFFRDTEMWDALRDDIIPSILAEKARRHGTTIRVWSAGCATGEEAYSLAIAFLDVMGAGEPRFSLSVHGTDLDVDALAVAERGFYPTERLAHVPADYLERYFEPLAEDGSGRRVSQRVRRLVRFQSFSLFNSSPMRLVDLVMCRNVFIYLDRLEQARVLDEFWGATMRGGYLVLGRNEKLAGGDVARFESVNSKERIFRKPVRP